MADLLGRAYDSVFLKRVATLFAGSSLAQLIVLLMMPVLSRIYAPDDFGVYGIIISLISIGGIVLSLRYENSILLVEEDSDAKLVLMGIFILSTILSLMLIISLWIVNGNIFNLDYFSVAIDNWWVIGLGAYFMSLIQALSVYAIRKKKFGQLSQARIGQSGFSVLSQFFFGIASVAQKGLIYGYLIGQILNLIWLFRGIGSLRKNFKLFASNRILFLAKKYKKFPIYSLPADMINVLGGSAPILLLGYFYGPAVAGSYAITQRFIGAPISIIGNSILEVYKVRAAESFRQSGRCDRDFRKIFIFLTGIGVFPTLLLFFYGEWFLVQILGAQWKEAGHFISIIAPLLLLQFVASPLGYTLTIAQKQNYDLIWQMITVAVIVGALFLGKSVGNQYSSLSYYVIGHASMYLIYLALSFKCSKGV